MNSSRREDLIIGVAIGYEFSSINNWAKSLCECGFTGRKILILGGVNERTIDKVKSLGIEVEIIDVPEGYISALIVADRFLILHAFLSENNNCRYVIVTDVRDVIFQNNPSDFLDQYESISEIGLIVSSESMKYEDEIWSNENLQNSFPEAAIGMQDKIIYNAGIIAGKPKYLSDMALQIFLLSKHNPISNPDQAALNILISSEAWSGVTKFSNQNDAWAFQGGTMMDPSKMNHYESKLLEDKAIITENWKVVNSRNVEFFILHQYDRIPELREYFDNKYNQLNNDLQSKTI